VKSPLSPLAFLFYLKYNKREKNQHCSVAKLLVMLVHRKSQHVSTTLESEQGLRSPSDKYPLLQTVIRPLNWWVSSPQITTAGCSRGKQAKSLWHTGLWGLKENL